MKTKSLLVIGILVTISCVLLPPLTSAQEFPINLELASQYFQEAEAISRQDNGRLWKASLYGPMILIDPESNSVVANQADLEGKLVQRGNVFIGKLPQGQAVGNTATKWAGVEWMMLVWPLPANKQDRARRMMHELFHRIQGRLGLPVSHPANSHLDTRDGRIWLQLEWRAIEVALLEQGLNRGKAIEDALAFRHYRRSLFPTSSNEEAASELGEGLAEYTAARLSASSNADFVRSVVSGLQQAQRRPTLARSFWFASGPAYGALLDQIVEAWRERVKAGDDLGSLLQNAQGIEAKRVSQDDALKRANRYDGAALIAAETQRENTRQEQTANYRSRLVDRPVLILPLSDNVRYSFDPNNPKNFVDLGDLKRVYPTLRVRDAWGVLEVSGGALIIREQGTARVQISAPTDRRNRPLRGEGWTLELNAGWSLFPGEKKGDFILRKIE